MFNYIRNTVNRVRYVRYGILAAVGYAAFLFFRRGR